MSIRDDLLAEFANKVTKALEHYGEMCDVADIDKVDALSALATVMVHIAALLMVPTHFGDDVIDELAKMFRKTLVKANDERRRAQGV